MNLSNELISQFVKVTKDDKKKSVESTVYGTTVVYDGKTYVKLDGSDLLTPVITTTDVESDERVTVMIKDHTATITGNITSPAARTDTVKEMGDKITEVEILVADKVSTEELEAESGRIDVLVSENVTIKEQLIANEAEIDKLVADNVTITGKLTATEAEITRLEAEKLSANVADIKFATIEKLEVIEGEFHSLESTYGEFQELTATNFEAVNAEISNLDAKYANIDFANVTEADIDKLLARSAIIEEVTSADGTFTRNLTAVTINGDLIEASTIKVDKLIVKGTDGNYYALNTDFSGITGVEPVEEDAIHGSILIAKSITADKVSVTDLVAFGATIGGFNITNQSLYSGVKASADNTTQGVYLDKDGQMSVGDSDNFLRYYKDEEDNYRLEIAASSLVFSANGKTVEQTIEEATDIEIGARNLVRNSKTLIFADYGFKSTLYPVAVDVENGMLTMTARSDTTSTFTSQVVDSVVSVTEQYETEATVTAKLVNDKLIVS